jgi:hypothetical protein
MAIEVNVVNCTRKGRSVILDDGPELVTARRKAIWVMLCGVDPSSSRDRGCIMVRRAQADVNQLVSRRL